MGGLANYLRYMADLLPRTTSATERDRIQRAVDQGFRNVAYHSTNDPWDEIDLNYADIGLHAGTPTQAANRALDKAIAAGIQARRGQGQYLPETHVMPLAYRIGDTLQMPDVGEWKDSWRTLMALRKHPELAGIKGGIDSLLEYVEPERQAYYDKADWLYDPTNLAVLQDARGLLLDLGYKQIEYPNAVENADYNRSAIMQSAIDRLEGIKSKAMDIYNLGQARMPKVPDLNATDEELQRFLGAKDALSFLTPEERALYDKYRDEAYAVREDPASYDNPNSLIFLDPADVRSINAEFSPGRAWEAGLFKAEGGPVKMGRGGLTKFASEAAEKAREQAAEVLPEAERKANLERFMAGSHVVDEQGQPRVMYHGTYAQPEFDEFNRLASVQNYRRAPSMDTIGTWVTSNPGKGGAEMYGSGQGAYTMPLYVNPKKTKTYETFDDYLQDMHAARGSSLERVRAEGKPAGLGSTEELRQRLIEEGYDSVSFARTNWKELKSMEETLRDRLASFQKEMGTEGRRLEMLGYKPSGRKWKETMQPLLSKEQRLKDSIFATRKQMERISGEFDDQEVLVMFHPEQIKSAIGNVGTYDPANPVITKKDGGPVYDPARISQMVDQLMGKPMAEGGPVKMQEGGQPEYAGAFDELVAAERAARLREAGTPLERYAYETLGMEPGLDRAAFLPYATAEGGRKEFAVPGLLYDAIKYGLAPGAAALGTPVSVEDAMGLASNVMGGGLGVSSPVDGAVAGMAIKQKGGNWLDGAIEDVMKPLRSRGVGEADRAWFEARAAENPDEYQMALQTIPRTEAINRWIDQKLAKYIRNEMATPEDPVLMQVDQFPAQKAEALAAKDAQIAKATADMERNRELRGFTPEMMTRAQAEIRKLQQERAFIEAQTGLHIRPDVMPESIIHFEIEPARMRADLPAEGVAKTDLGRRWEARADSLIESVEADRYFEDDALGADLWGWAAQAENTVRENPWLEKLPGHTPVHHLKANMEGAAHLMDELKNAIRPNTDLPPELRITPETLNKMNVAQAVRLVDKINAWRSVQKAEADLVSASNVATFPYRTYDTIPGTDQPNTRGLRWVQLRTPDDPSADPDALAKALKYEGDMLQHCVGGYCPAVESGESMIYSLRDAEGRPYTTIEVTPNPKPYPTSGEAFVRLSPSEKAQYREYVRQWRMRNPDIEELTDEQVAQALKEAGVPPQPDQIEQIKAHRNEAPAQEYLPFVQDFVRSGNWGGVGDIDYAQLRPKSDFIDMFTPDELDTIGPGKYVTMQEVEQLRKQLGKKKGGPVQMKDGGDLEMNAPDVTLGSLLRKYGPEFLAGPLDELAELRGAYNAGLDTQIAPDEGGLPGLALTTLSLPDIALDLVTIAGEGLAHIDPKMGLGVIDAASSGKDKLAEYVPDYSSRYDEHLNRMLEKYGLPESGQLDALDRFALAAGEMTGQAPMPATWLRKLKGIKGVIPKTAALFAEYFGPTVDPKLANYVVGTGVGGGLRQLDDPAEPERARDTLTYAPPSFPGMAEGGPVYDQARIDAMVDSLMAPKMAQGGPVARFARGGLGKSADEAARRVKDAVNASALSAPEAGRIEQSVTREMSAPAQRPYGRSTIRGAGRKTFPGIFEDPRAIVRNASQQVAPESDALRRLFGVTREDLYDMSMAREPTIWLPPGAPKNPRGTEHAGAVMLPANTIRLQDTLAEALKSPLRPGMVGWYIMDPVYQRLLQLVEPEEAARMYLDLNTLTGAHSAMSDVNTELTRGTAMNWLNRQGRLDDYIRFGGKMGQPGVPEDMVRVPGHMAHSGAHLTPALRYLETGALSKEAKTPAYITASMPVELGTQTNFPVGDAHFSRAIGLPDVRPLVYNKKTGRYEPNVASWSMPEAMELQSWWADEVAGPVGLQAVPGQALLWGAGAPITGVDSPIGATKLELLADLIMKTAARLNVSPERARDLVLTGQAYAGYADGGLVSYLQHLARK